MLYVAISLSFHELSKSINPPFPLPRPSNSQYWHELACDVIEQLTLFCFGEEYMRTCDNVIQNRCRMKGRCVVGRSGSTPRLGKSDSLYSTPLSVSLLKG